MLQGYKKAVIEGDQHCMDNGGTVLFQGGFTGKFPSLHGTSPPLPSSGVVLDPEA